MNQFRSRRDLARRRRAVHIRILVAGTPAQLLSPRASADVYTTTANTTIAPARFGLSLGV